MKYAQRAQEIIDIEIEGLQRVRNELDEHFGKAVELLLDRLNRGGKLVVTGLGKSLHIGQKIAATLTSTGSPAVILHPAEAMHGDLGILGEQDALLALSYSGESEELLNLLMVVKRRGLAVIALTGVPESTIAQYADELIPIPVDREACPFNMAPTTSTTAMLAVGDALAMVLLEARGFKREDYAKLHPGGAIGRTLLLRVEDIMRTDDRLARVSPDTSVRDAVLAMTSARAGSAAVVDEDGRLLGIITDGDLRRHLTGNGGFTERPVREIMTPDPITLCKDNLAVDILTLFEKHNIDDLVIVDADNRAVGLVDIQDLPKFKIL